MKTWLITGCSSGLGHAIALEALAKGDRVAAGTRRPQAAEAFSPDHPDRVLPLVLDVADPASVQAAICAVKDWVGHVDVLVNNAGYGLYGAVEEVSDEEARSLFETNVFGVARLARGVLPGMRARGAGTIVNIGSVAGIVGGPGNSFYAASKFAIEAISEALNAELGPLGIRTILIDPSGIRSDFHGRSYRRAQIVIDDYEATAGKQIASNLGFNGKQAGDPRRIARTIARVVEMDAPPFRLLVGSMCIERVRTKLTAMLEDIERWKEVSRSVDFVNDDYPPDKPFPGETEAGG